MAVSATDVQKAYLAYFGRPADPAGLAYWQTSTAAIMKAGFAASAEYSTMYAGMTVEQRVAQVYTNLLGRTADDVGKAYWAAEITAGRQTIGTLVDSMQTNALGADITTIANRVTFANAFTAAVDTAAEIAAYSGTSAANSARAAVLPVTTDATLTTAVAAVNTAVATVVTAATTGTVFTLTNSATPDILSLTSGVDTVTAAVGTLAATDVIVDASTTDADVMNLTMNSYVSTQATITNVETINATSAYASVGLDAANVTGTKVLNLVSSIAGSTGTAAGVTATKVATINAGTNVAVLNVDTTAVTSGTSGNVTVNAGAATTVTIGAVGATGSDTFTLNPVAASTITLMGGSAGTDTFTVNLVGGATTLLTTNNAAGTGDINVLNLNSNTAANTVTLTGATHVATGFATGDGIVVGGTQALTLKGNTDTLVDTAGASSRTNGVAITKAAGAGTVTVEHSTGTLTAASFYNRAIGVDTLKLSGATGQNITVNEATTVQLAVANGTVTYDVDNNTATQAAAGSGTLKLDLAGSSVANATQTSITTGAGAGTVVITDSTIDSTITTLDTSATAATVDTVIVSGNKALTIGTWTATATEVLTATGMTGALTATIGANAATVIGGSGNDVLTGGGAADKLVGGAGDDTINGGAFADTITGGLGNDRFIIANNATIDTITDFSVSGTNGVDVLSLSVGAIAGALSQIRTGAGNVTVAAGNVAAVQHITAATTLAGNNVFVIDGTFATSALMEVAIEAAGTRQLTLANAPTANDDLMVVWTDGTNGHYGYYNLATTATIPTAAGTYTEIATLNGVTDVTAFASANFLFAS